MKNSLGKTAAGMTLLLAAAAVQAQSADKLYLDVRAGVALPEETAIQSDAFGTGNGGQIKYDPGLHAGVNLGYHFNRSFAFELESGVIWNTINYIGFNSLSQFSASADFNQIPILASVIYQPWHGAFAPYFGIGAGGMATFLKVSNFPGIADYSDMDFVFGYQATVGFKYAVSRHIDVGLAYQFLGTGEHNWSDHNVPFNTDGVMTHSIMATFTWRF